MNILEAIKEVELGNRVKCKTFEDDGYTHEIEILSMEGFEMLSFTAKQVLSNDWGLTN